MELLLRRVGLILVLIVFLCGETEGKRDIELKSLPNSFFQLKTNTRISTTRAYRIASWTQIINTKLQRSRRLLQTSRDNCTTTGCSRNGVVRVNANGTRECECEAGFSGQDCQLNDEICSGGQLSYTGDCCRSGVFNSTGFCCGSSDEILDRNHSIWRLDVNGNCCALPLDACGQCGGNGFIDSRGNCCNVALDANGICCESNDVDQCGVCDGFGQSCTTRVEIIVANEQRNAQTCLKNFLPSFLLLVPQTPVEVTRLRGGVKRFTVEANGSSFNTEQINTRFSTLVNRSDGNPCSIIRTSNAIKVPVCGNNICEIGEASSSSINNPNSCPQDCTLTITSCSSRKSTGVVGRTDTLCSGNGVCFYAQNGTCGCFNGYTGEACDQCSDGFHPFNQLCVPRQWLPEIPVESCVTPSSINIPSTNTTSTNALSTDTPSSDDSDLGLILGLLVGGGISALLLLIMLVLIGRTLAMKGSRERAANTEATITSTGGGGGGGEASPSGGSLFAAYMRGWISFQRNPPWIGSFHEPLETDG
eukprot:g3696.t1